MSTGCAQARVGAHAAGRNSSSSSSTTSRGRPSALYDAERGAELVDRSRAEYHHVALASRLVASVGVGGGPGGGRRRPGRGRAAAHRRRVVPGQRAPAGLDRPHRPHPRRARRLGALGAGGGVVTAAAAGAGLGAAPARRVAGALPGAPAPTAPSTRPSCAGWVRTSSRSSRRPGARLLVGLRRHRRRAVALSRRLTRRRDPSGRVDVVRRQLALGELAAARGGRSSSSSIASMMCLRTMLRGSRSRSSRSEYSGPSSVRSSSRAELAIARALRSMTPACLAITGSRSGPNTSTATRAMTASSSSPTSNMGQNLAVGVSPSCMPASPRPRPASCVGHRAQLHGGRRGGVGLDDRLAGVAALAQRRVERDAAQDRDVVAEALRERLRRRGRRRRCRRPPWWSRRAGSGSSCSPRRR